MSEELVLKDIWLLKSKVGGLAFWRLIRQYLKTGEFECYAVPLSSKTNMYLIPSAALREKPHLFTFRGEGLAAYISEIRIPSDFIIKIKIKVECKDSRCWDWRLVVGYPSKTYIVFPSSRYYKKTVSETVRATDSETEVL